VYKLAAVRHPGGPWSYRVKLSEQAVKISNPGIQQVRRMKSGGEFVADVIYDEGLGIEDGCTLVDPMDATRQKVIAQGTPWENLLVPVFEDGRRVYPSPPLTDSRARTIAQLANFNAGVKRLANPHQYPVGLERKLHDLKTKLILEARHVVPVRGAQ
jgi:nicotinate phosphoribosyltransferase